MEVKFCKLFRFLFNSQMFQGRKFLLKLLFDALGFVYKFLISNSVEWIKELHYNSNKVGFLNYVDYFTMKIIWFHAENHKAWLKNLQVINTDQIKKAEKAIRGLELETLLLEHQQLLSYYQQLLLIHHHEDTNFLLKCAIWF